METSQKQEISFRSGEPLDLANAIENGLKDYDNWYALMDWQDIRSKCDFQRTTDSYLSLIETAVKKRKTK